jgi:thiamine-phosphate pyrophosphorylase
VAGGCRLLQLRVKALGSQAFLDLARTVVAIGGRAGARVVVNDRADVAMLAGAAGVHVGQEDLDPSDVRRMAPPGFLIGLSTHTDAQLRTAVQAPVDYIAIGPVFGTATKDTGYLPIGLDGVRHAARVAGEAGLPLVAIGGITFDTAPAVVGAGAGTVAVISDLLSGDPESRTRAFVERLR